MNRSIKIITYGNFPFGGASANLLRNLALGLIVNGDKVEVLLPNGHSYSKNIDYNPSSLNKNSGYNYKHFCFDVHPSNYFGKLIDNFIGSINLCIYLVIKKLTGNVDIIIKYNTFFFSDLLFISISKILNIKTINIIPEFYEKPSNSWGVKRFKWYSFYFGLKYVVKYSNGLIVLSSYLKDFFKKKIGYDRHIIIQPNLIDYKRFQIDVKLKDKDTKYTIGYVGTPREKDGITDLLESIKILSNKHPFIKLLIIGDATNGLSIIPKLQKQATELNIAKNVTFTGLMPSERIPNLLLSCEILILARPNGVFAEAGFPTKLGEYFACKKPVVITKVGDIKNYFINKKHAVLVEPENPYDIANGIDYLLMNKIQAKEIGKWGYKWMLENLDYRIVATKIDTLIDDVLSDTSN